MSNLSARKLISLVILLSFIIVQFALILPPVSAQVGDASGISYFNADA